MLERTPGSLLYVLLHLERSCSYLSTDSLFLCSSSLVNVSSSAACRETFELLSTAVLRRLTDENADGSPSTLENPTLNGDGTLIDGTNTSIPSPFPGGGAGTGPDDATTSNGQSFASSCGPHPASQLDASNNDNTSGIAPVPLPTDLRGLDDLLLNPLGAHMGICEPSSQNPFGQFDASYGMDSFDQQSLFDTLINSPAPNSNMGL